MSEDSIRQERLNFFGIESADVKELQESLPFLEKKLQGVLDHFYSYVVNFPKLKTLVGDQVSVLKQAQTEHWKHVFSGQFNEDYFERAQKIGIAHEKIGLEPRWYIGGYALVFQDLLDIFIDEYIKNPAELKRKTHAFTKAIFLDMDIAISVYIMRSEAEKIKQKMLAMSDQLENTLHTAVANIIEKIEHMRRNSEVMNSSAARVSDKVHQAYQASEHTNTNVQSVAASSEQLTASIQEITRQTGRSSTITNAAVQNAQQATETIQRLSKVVSSIGEVIELINTIANQTNLLALNATIEAARAGEAGKGFSVVASEVKALATQTAKATNDIGAQISSIQSITQKVVEVIEIMGKTIEEVSQISSSVSSAVEQQDMATQEISTNMQEVASDTNSINENMSSITGEIEENSKISQEIKKHSTEIAMDMIRLKEQLVTVLRESEAGNRRKNKRYKPNNMTVTIKGTSGSGSYVVKDLSLEGLSIQVEQGCPFSKGEIVTLDIPGLSTSIHASVIQTDISRNFIRFHVDAHPQVATMLEDYFNRTFEVLS